MSDLHVETLILKNGERYPVLMTGNNVPHDCSGTVILATH